MNRNTLIGFLCGSALVCLLAASDEIPFILRAQNFWGEDFKAEREDEQVSGYLSPGTLTLIDARRKEDVLGCMITTNGMTIDANELKMIITPEGLGFVRGDVSFTMQIDESGSLILTRSAEEGAVPVIYTLGKNPNPPQRK